MRPIAGRRRGAAPQTAPSRVARALSCVMFCLVAVAGLMVIFSFRGSRDDGFASQLHRKAGVRPFRLVPGAVVSTPNREEQALPTGAKRVRGIAGPPARVSVNLRDLWGLTAAPHSDAAAPSTPQAPAVSAVAAESVANENAFIPAPNPPPAPSPSPASASLAVQPPPPTVARGGDDVTPPAAPDAALDPATATLSDILRARRLRPFRQNPRQTRGNHQSAAEPDMVLLDPGEDPDAGIAFAPPVAGIVPSDEPTAAARRAHERSATLAVVVVTSPRAMAMARDRAVPRYFRFSGACSSDAVYESDPVKHADCSATSELAACIEVLAAQCDTDARCVGFSARGTFYEHADVLSCGQQLLPGSVFDGPPLEGTYLKAPLSVVPTPRRLYVNASSAAGDWWTVKAMDIIGHDIGHAPPPVGEERSFAVRLADVMARCASEPRCAAFNLPGGWLKDSAHPADASMTPASDIVLVARNELPPQDYLTTTVVSLMDEIGSGCDAGGAFGGGVHLYVMDTSPRSLHEQGGRLIAEVRGPTRADYWFRAFAWLRLRYGTLPCITFVPATSYTRQSEIVPPPVRGTPHFHPDNQQKAMPRGIVQQTLDFSSALRYAAAASPSAHVMVWEDDCFACHGSLAALHDAVSAISTFDPAWGSVKIGNGGSGMLFHAEIVGNLLGYLQTRRGSENIDVSMWRYLNSGGYSDCE